MCNAWNHPPGCRCGWGGDGHLGRRTTGNSYGSWSAYDLLREYGGHAGHERVYTDSYVNPNAHCPVCGAPVFFYQSPYGGRVYFDELGWPWPKHPCTDNSQHYRALTPADSQSLDHLYARLRVLNLPTRHEPRVQPQRPAVPLPEPAKVIDEAAFAKLMEEGETAQRHGDHFQAAMLYAEAITTNFCSARAWLALARVLADRQERAYCLTKVLRLATSRDNIKAESIEKELAQLKVDQLKHPRILWPTKLPAVRPQQTSLAKPVQPATKPQKDTSKWSLIVRIGKGGQRVVWLVIAAGLRRQGEVPISGRPSTALLHGILKGLQESTQLAGVGQAQLTVMSNDQSVIRQANGEAKIKHEEDRALLATVYSLRAKIRQLIFTTKSTSDIEIYFKN